MKLIRVLPIRKLIVNVSGHYVCFVASSGRHICLPLLYCSLGDAKEDKEQK